MRSCLFSSSSKSVSRCSIFAAVARPEAKLEQMRCSSNVFIKPAALLRFLKAAVNDSAAW